MQVRVFLAVLFFSLSVCTSYTPAQTNAIALPLPVAPTLPSPVMPTIIAPNALPMFVTRVDEVNLVLSVTNDRGRFVRDLNPNDLVITDNGEPPAKITYFQTRTDLPLRVALVIDTSDSVAYRFAFEQKCAAAFLKNVLRLQDDAAAIIAFNEKPRVVQDVTGDVSQLRVALQSLKPGGETSLYDAIAVASEALSRSTGAGPVRRVIVLVTDGEENRSHITRDKAIERALRAESAIYVVNTKEAAVSREDQLGDEVIQRLARSTGGRVLDGKTESDVANSFRKIQEELRSQYALGYRPRSLLGNLFFRPVRIFGPKGVRIRTREGYYVH